MMTSSCKIEIGRLDGKDNWTTWRCKVLLLLRGTPGGLDAVEGKLKAPIPPESLTAEATASYKKALQLYNEMESTAMLILLANMTDNTVQKVMRFSTAIGTECYAHVPKQKRTKMSKKAQKCILIGYDGDDGYRLLGYNKKNEPVLIRSRDVVFKESIIKSVGLESEFSENNYQSPSTEIEIHFPKPEEDHPMLDAREEVLQDQAEAQESSEMPQTSNDLIRQEKDVDDYYSTPDLVIWIL